MSMYVPTDVWMKIIAEERHYLIQEVWYAQLRMHHLNKNRAAAVIQVKWMRYKALKWEVNAHLESVNRLRMEHRYVDKIKECKEGRMSCWQGLTDL